VARDENKKPNEVKRKKCVQVILIFIIYQFSAKFYITAFKLLLMCWVGKLQTGNLSEKSNKKLFKEIFFENI
jgi:hypothetical protein